MFNLEQSIANWRQQMLAAGIKTPVPLDELEAHLREEIERQMLAGFHAQYAFDIAARQIGQGKQLKTEFSKGRRLRDILEMELISKEGDLKWLKWGPVLHMAITTSLFLFAGSMVLLKIPKGSFADMTSVEQISSLTAIAIFYSLSCGGWLGYKFFPVIPKPKMRLAIYGAVLVSVWVMIFVLWANFGQQFEVAFLWAFLVPLGVFSGLILGLERAAQKKTEAAGS